MKSTPLIELAYKKKYWTELGRIHNFPAIKTNEKVYNGEGKKWKQFLKNNPILKDILIKIGNETLIDEYSVNSDMYCDFTLHGNFEKELNTVWFYVSGDGCIVITDTMDYFDEEYRTFEKWSIDKWKLII